MGTNHHIGLASLGQKQRDFLRLVLAVSIHRDDSLIALLYGQPYAQLHGAPCTQRQHWLQDFRPGGASLHRCVVPAVVVHHQHMVPAMLVKGLHHGSNGGRLVSCRNDDQDAVGLGDGTFSG